MGRPPPKRSHLLHRTVSAAALLDSNENAFGPNAEVDKSRVKGGWGVIKEVELKREVGEVLAVGDVLETKN